MQIQLELSFKISTIRSHIIHFNPLCNCHSTSTPCHGKAGNILGTHCEAFPGQAGCVWVLKIIFILFLWHSVAQHGTTLSTAAKFRLLFIYLLYRLHADRKSIIIFFYIEHLFEVKQFLIEISCRKNQFWASMKGKS